MCFYKFPYTKHTYHSPCFGIKVNTTVMDTKKAWSPTVVVPRVEAFALPIVLDRQREAHAEYKYTLVLHS